MFTPFRGRFRRSVRELLAARSLALSGDCETDDRQARGREDDLPLRFAGPAPQVPLAALPDDESKNLVTHRSPSYPSRSCLTRQAIRDWSEKSSMNPGAASWENSPPD